MFVGGKLINFSPHGAAIELQEPGRFLEALRAAIPLSVIWLLPQMESYRGLSGIDTALFALLVTSLLADRVRESDRAGAMLFALFLVALFGKIALEMASRANVFVSDTSFTPIPLSHLVGAAIGMTSALLTLPSRFNRECRHLAQKHATPWGDARTRFSAARRN